MTKTIFLINACEAGGTEKLTVEEQKRAQNLSSFFSSLKVEKIICSPCGKALASIQPAVKQERLTVQKDERLAEVGRKTDFGEKAEEALTRILEVVKEVSFYEKTLIVTHPDILTALLQYYSPHYGLKPWETLRIPDVFRLDITHESKKLVRVQYSRDTGVV